MSSTFKLAQLSPRGARDTTKRRDRDALHDASGSPAHSGPVVQRTGRGREKEETKGRGVGRCPLGHVLREAYMRAGSRPLETELQKGGERGVERGRGASVTREGWSLCLLDRVSLLWTEETSVQLVRRLRSCCGERIAVQV